MFSNDAVKGVLKSETVFASLPIYGGRLNAERALRVSAFDDSPNKTGKAYTL